MSETPEKTGSIYSTKHFPVFSVITITLNNYQGLRKTYNSIKEQSFKDFEWLVIDGGSNDKTMELLRTHRSETRANLNPFRFVSQPDKGIYDAMNTGIKLARGHYVIFMNAGDTFADETTLKTLAPMAKKAPDFIYGDALEQYRNGRKPVTKPARCHKDINKGMFTHHQAMIYRRHTIRDARLHYSLRYKIASDYDFTARFLRESKKIQYIKKPICVFEMGGISQQNAWLGRKEQYIIREELEMTPLIINLWILLKQTLSWHLKNIFPHLHKILKTAEMQLLQRKKP